MEFPPAKDFPNSGIDVQNAGMDRWKLQAKLAAFPYFRDEAFLASHVVLEKYMFYNL